MIITEVLREKLERHCSDIGMKLRQVETGILYDDAVDWIPCAYTYEETDKRMETEEDFGV